MAGIFEHCGDKVEWWVVLGDQVFPYTDRQTANRERRLEQDLRFEPMIVTIVDHPSEPAPDGKRCAICGGMATNYDPLGYFCADHIAIDPISRAKMTVWGDDNEEQSQLYIEVSNGELDAVYEPVRPIIVADIKPDGRGDIGSFGKDGDQLELWENANE
jgi:hypothetical protein